jgi:hypothetical protein
MRDTRRQMCPARAIDNTTVAAPLGRRRRHRRRRRLRVLTINVYDHYLSPSPDKERRTDHLLSLPLWRDFDVVCIQELFTLRLAARLQLDASVRRVARIAAHAAANGLHYHVAPPTTPSLSILAQDSGLHIFSRFPVVRAHTESFLHYTWREAVNAKGFLAALVLVPPAVAVADNANVNADTANAESEIDGSDGEGGSRSVWILNSHTDANSASVRFSQLEQMWRWLRSAHSSRTGVADAAVASLSSSSSSAAAAATAAAAVASVVATGGGIAAAGGHDVLSAHSDVVGSGRSVVGAVNANNACEGSDLVVIAGDLNVPRNTAVVDVNTDVDEHGDSRVGHGGSVSDSGSGSGSGSGRDGGVSEYAAMMRLFSPLRDALADAAKYDDATADDVNTDEAIFDDNAAADRASDDDANADDNASPLPVVASAALLTNDRMRVISGATDYVLYGQLQRAMAGSIDPAFCATADRSSNRTSTQTHDAAGICLVSCTQSKWPALAVSDHDAVFATLSIT